MSLKGHKEIVSARDLDYFFPYKELIRLGYYLFLELIDGLKLNYIALMELIDKIGVLVSDCNA